MGKKSLILFSLLFISHLCFSQHQSVEIFKKKVGIKDTLYLTNSTDSLKQFIYNHKYYFISTNGIDSILFLKNGTITALKTNISGSGGSADSTVFSTRYDLGTDTNLLKTIPGQYFDYTNQPGAFAHGVAFLDVFDHSPIMGISLFDKFLYDKETGFEVGGKIATGNFGRVMNLEFNTASAIFWMGDGDGKTTGTMLYGDIPSKWIYIYSDSLTVSNLTGTGNAPLNVTSNGKITRGSNLIPTSWLNYVSAANGVNTTLFGSQTIDGVSVDEGDRVLLTGQSTDSQNGIYDVHHGAWTRAADADAGSEIFASAVHVKQGGTNWGSTTWYNTNTSAITIGSTSITYSSFVNNNGVYPPTLALLTDAPPMHYNSVGKYYYIDDAFADGTSKGASTFNASDFNDNGSGLISFDYTNGQAASGSTKGLLTSANWTTFNNKVSSSRTINTNAPLSGGADLSHDLTLSADTSSGAAALATQDDVRNTDSVGTIVRGIWHGTAIDTTYSNGVSRIVVGTGLTLITKGKTDSLIATGADSSTFSTHHYTDSTVTAHEKKEILFTFYQESTTAPTITTLYNNSDFTISASHYDDVGQYHLIFTPTGADLDTKTFIVTVESAEEYSPSIDGNVHLKHTRESLSGNNMFFETYLHDINGDQTDNTEITWYVKIEFFD